MFMTSNIVILSWFGPFMFSFRLVLLSVPVPAYLLCDYMLHTCVSLSLSCLVCKRQSLSRSLCACVVPPSASKLLFFKFEPPLLSGLLCTKQIFASLKAFFWS